MSKTAFLPVFLGNRHTMNETGQTSLFFVRSSKFLRFLTDILSALYKNIMAENRGALVPLNMCHEVWWSAKMGNRNSAILLILEYNCDFWSLSRKDHYSVSKFQSMENLKKLFTNFRLTVMGSHYENWSPQHSPSMWVSVFWWPWSDTTTVTLNVTF